MRVSHEKLLAVLAKAQGNGLVEKEPNDWVWKLAGKCSMPRIVVLRAAGSHDQRSQGAQWYDMRLRMQTRCRRCAACLSARGSEWEERALAEYVNSPRTWFGTMTLSPGNHVEILSHVRAALARKGSDFDGLAPVEQFKLLAKEASDRFVTPWIRELRRERVPLLDNAGVPVVFKSGPRAGEPRGVWRSVPLRYLCVAEAHPHRKRDPKTGVLTAGENAGLPHVHVLVHEVHANRTVSARRMEALWSGGKISRFRLVRNEYRATYPCKYLTKSMLARVRASFDYGKTALAIAEGVSSHTDGPPQGAGALC